MSAHVWIRHESRAYERRVPIVPEDARRLVDAGMRVTLETSPQRIIGPGEYRDAGVEITDPGSWVDAPDDAYILGLKELPEEPEALRHTHLYFAHAYRGQHGAQRLLGRFRRGGGRLLDLEYLTNGDGHRVVAFGRWAGYAGASLGLLQLAGRLETPVEGMERAALDGELLRLDTAGVRALVVGAKGRSGKGAVRALKKVNVEVTAWDREETDPLDKEALLDHDLLVNCIGGRHTAPVLFTTEDLDAQRRLRVIADVTVDVTSEHNGLPVNTEVTTWEEPVRRFEGAGGPLDVIAIDNLPSLLPRESSTSFSGELTPLLLGLEERTEPWRHAEEAFDEAVAALPAD